MCPPRPLQRACPPFTDPRSTPAPGYTHAHLTLTPHCLLFTLLALPLLHCAEALAEREEHAHQADALVANGVVSHSSHAAEINAALHVGEAAGRSAATAVSSGAVAGADADGSGSGGEGEAKRVSFELSKARTELDLMKKEEVEVQAKLEAHMTKLNLQLQASDVLADLHNARQWVRPLSYLRRSMTTHHGGLTTVAPLERSRTSAAGLGAATFEAETKIGVAS